MKLQTSAVIEGFLALAARVGLLVSVNTVLGEEGHGKGDFIAVSAAVDLVSFVQ